MNGEATPGLPPVDASSVVQTASASSPFVGRGAELRALFGALDRSEGGTAQLVMLAGDAGMGKTRLCQELAAEAARRNISAIWGRCFEEPGAPPFWPWTQAMGTLLETWDDAYLRAIVGDEASPVAGIVPELGHRLGAPLAPAALEADQLRFQLFYAVSQFWQRAAEARGLLLILDNLHWADPTSLRLLGFIGADLGAHRLMLVGTYRHTEVSRQHPLGELLADLIRSPGYQRLQLTGLSREETEQLYRSASGTSPLPETIETLHTRTEGHPLFLVETLRYLRAEQRTKASMGDDDAGILGAIPDGVRAVIGKRLNRLAAPCARLLAIAACIGRSFSLDLLRPLVAESSEDAVLAALEEAVAARLLEPLPAPDQYQFSHTLIRETLYDEMLPARRTRLHLRIGELLEAHHSDTHSRLLPQLAYHFAAALPEGCPDRALDYVRRAADSAAGLLAHEAAARLYRQALDLQERYFPEAQDTRCTLLLGLGAAQDSSGASEASGGTYLEAAATARELGSDVALVQAAIGFETAGWALGHPGAEAVVLLTEALETAQAQQNKRLRVDLLASLCRAYAFTDRPVEATGAYRAAAALARQIDDPSALFRALVALQATRFFWPNQLEDRLAAAREALALAEQHRQEAWALAGLYGWHFSDLVEKGELESAAAIAADHVRIAEEVRQPFFQAVGLSSQTLLAIHEGRFDDAETLARETFKVGRRFSAGNAAGAYGMQMFSIRREQGRLAEVLPVLRHFVATRASSVWRPGLAVLYIELDLRAPARAELDALAADGFAAIPHSALWPTSIAFLAEVCADLEDAARAAVLYRMLLPYAGRNIATGNNAPCFGSADRLLGMLAVTLGKWDGAAGHFEAALAMNRRTGGRAWLAHTQHAYAALLLRQTNRGAERGKELLDAALSTARELGMAALERRCTRLMAQLERRVVFPDGLSKREVDVLRLIAEGLSNQEIGARLFISTHTVANHIRNILAKTRTGNRTEAAAYAIRHGLEKV